MEQEWLKDMNGCENVRTGLVVRTRAVVEIGKVVGHWSGQFSTAYPVFIYLVQLSHSVEQRRWSPLQEWMSEL